MCACLFIPFLYYFQQATEQKIKEENSEKYTEWEEKEHPTHIAFVFSTRNTHSSVHLFNNTTSANRRKKLRAKK